jgi:hypothetical protein
MQQHIPRTRWRPWWQVLPFGVLLALLNLSLFGMSTATSEIITAPQAIVIGLILYLVIPAFAGHWSRYQRQHEGWSGFRVGLVGAAIFMLTIALTFVIMFMRYINMPPNFTPGAPHQWGLYEPARELMILATILGLLLLLNGVGLLLGAIGGRIGGTLAISRLTPHLQSHEPWPESRG